MVYIILTSQKKVTSRVTCQLWQAKPSGGGAVDCCSKMSGRCGEKQKRNSRIHEAVLSSQNGFLFLTTRSFQATSIRFVAPQGASQQSPLLRYDHTRSETSDLKKPEKGKHTSGVVLRKRNAATVAFLLCMPTIGDGGCLLAVKRQ